MNKPVQHVEVDIQNGQNVPCVGGPADGAHIPFKGTPHGIRVERPPTIATVNPQSVFEQATYHAAFFRVDGKAYVVYRHESFSDGQTIATLFSRYGLFDTRRPNGPNSGGKGKGFH